VSEDIEPRGSMHNLYTQISQASLSLEVILFHIYEFEIVFSTLSLTRINLKYTHI
jgi:hypothetical protein